MAYKVAKVGKGEIYALPCPKADQLEKILNGLKEQGVNRVVSLLEVPEAAKLGVSDEPEICQQLGMVYQNYPIRDFATAENRRKFTGLINELHGRLLDGENIAVHCYAGIGRTGLVIGSTLIRHGVPAKEAMDWMSEARGRNMPQTQEQYEYLLDFEERADWDSVDMTVKKDPAINKGWLRRWFSR